MPILWKKFIETLRSLLVVIGTISFGLTSNYGPALDADAPILDDIPSELRIPVTFDLINVPGYTGIGPQSPFIWPNLNSIPPPSGSYGFPF